jgi:2-polyprenyl-3-methyl-5-hydroxy-6-metoxy-1,4-benzoquinol methylase
VSADRGRAVSRRTSYAWHCRDRTPNALVVEAVSILDRSNGAALDIGAGSLSSSGHLLSAGFRVDAVDPDPHTLKLAAAMDNPRLSLQCADIRDIPITEGRFDLIVAVHVLHLIPRRDLETLVPTLAYGLTDGGIFCATFVGVRDTWARTPWRATALRRTDVLALTSELDVVRLDELEYDGVNVLGQPKHWHTLRCLLQKRAA